MQKYENLGQVFKELRTNRHVSLKQVANEEVSISQISRFERGESELSVRRLLIALDNMKVEASEYFRAVNDYKSSEQIKLMKSLVKLEYQRDIEGFRQRMQEQEEKYREHPDVYRYHLNAILLQSFICKCDETIPFPKAYMDQITDYLFTTELWDEYELILIGNLYMFMDIPLLHNMGKEIISRKNVYCGVTVNKSLVAIVLLNIYETCLYRDSLEVADYYRREIKVFLDDETDLYKRTIFLFLCGYHRYKAGDMEGGTVEMEHAIQIFEWLGCDNLASNYKKDFAYMQK